MFNFFKKNKGLPLLLPAEGKLIELADVPDEAFASKMLGDGYAVIPSDGKFKAPIDGKISFIFPTGHAFGIEHEDLDILVHIGIDTVQMDGKGFNIVKQAGDQVKAGDVVIEVDLAEVEAAGKSPVTPVIVMPKGDKKTIKMDLAAGTVELV